MIGPVGISGHEIPRPLLRLLTSNALTIFWVSLASPWSTVCHILPDSALVRDRSYPQQGLKAWIRGESCLFIFAIYKHIHKLIKMHIHNIHVYIYTLHALNFVYIYIYNLYIYIYIYTFCHIPTTSGVQLSVVYVCAAYIVATPRVGSNLALSPSHGLESIMPRRSKSSCRYSTQLNHHRPKDTAHDRPMNQ